MIVDSVRRTFICDMCGSKTMYDAPEGTDPISLPRFWAHGYNPDIHVCSVCSDALFRTKDVNVLREFCSSQSSCDECIMKGNPGTCGLQHVPEDNNWLNCREIFNQSYRPIFAEAVMHIRKLCIQRDCAAESGTLCRYYREHKCMFKYNAPKDWVVD